MTERELLQFAVDSGKIDIDEIKEEMARKKNAELLAQHEYKIWQGADGKFYTYLPDEDKGRKKIKKNTQKEVEAVVISYYNKKESMPTINQIFYAWVEEKLRYGEIQKQTYDRYITDFDRFFKNNKFMPNFHRRRMHTITESDLEEFIKITIAEMELTQKAYSKMKLILMGILKYAKKRDFTNISATYFLAT